MLIVKMEYKVRNFRFPLFVETLHATSLRVLNHPDGAQETGIVGSGNSLPLQNLRAICLSSPM